MKLVGIGDLFIPHEYIRKGFAQVEALGVNVSTFDWKLSGFPELQAINLKVEKGGAAAYEPPPEVFEAVGDADILITQFCPVSAGLLAAAKSLKALGVLRAGYENVDIAAATARGILVLNTPGRNADAVADFAVGMILAEARNIGRGHAGLKDGHWIREYPNSGMIPDMPGKTVGLVGLGEIGRKVARRLSGFDVKVIAYDPFVKDAPAGVELVSLPELMAQSDFVTIHARLTKETEGMIGSELLGMMKKTAYLINTSRSALVNEGDLYEALKSKRIAGAALDVFDLEPPGADYPLVRLPNVTVTPHMAGGSNDAFYNCPKLLAAEFVKLLSGGEPKSIVNREVMPTARNRLGI